jgi:hypothetical protein
LATFVVPQIAAEALERAQQRTERRFAAVIISALTVFSVAVDGYHPYAEDGGLYMAGVKRLLDPALYPHGTDFVLAPMRYSLFAPAVAALVRLTHMGLPVVLLGIHLVSVSVTLFAAWMLASRCWATREARAGAVALLACWLDLPVAGTALLWMDPYVTARSLSTPCMVLALVGVLDMTGQDGTRWRGLGLWVGSLALAAAMHPLMAAYALGASLVLLCVRASRRDVRVWGTLGLCGAALGLAARLQAIAPAESTKYVRVAMTRSYWFLSEWRWFEVVGLIAPLAIVGWWARWSAGTRTYITEARYRAPDLVAGRTALARMAIAVGVTATLVASIFARGGAATHLVARMQPLRAFQVVYLVMMLVLGATMGERVLQRNAWRWAVTLVLIGGTMLTAARAAFPDSRHVEMPWAGPQDGAQNPWVRAFVWVRENTPKDALFALDADYINAPGEDAQCFRAIAERSALADYSKDGGEASIAPELTAEWAAGQRAQARLSAETDAERIEGLRPLEVTWVVLQVKADTGFDCPYRNDAVEVCRLR